jgi:hypothetical protein
MLRSRPTRTLVDAFGPAEVRGVSGDLADYPLNQPATATGSVRRWMVIARLLSMLSVMRVVLESGGSGGGFDCAGGE